MSPALPFWLAVSVFPISEIALGIFKRARLKTADLQDRGSLRTLWVVISLSVALAAGAQWLSFGRLPFALASIHSAALAVLLFGLAIRWVAIITLGRFFTVNVAIQQDHHVVQSGLYRFVRHPSYTGLLLCFLGVGLAFANWVSMLVLIVPTCLALAARIAVEERALLVALGPEYEAYSSRTYRLVPGIF